jgi:leucyl/phenylalanyl-tRNA--protein transferase
MNTVLTPEILLNAYASGIFPMSESRENPELFWFDPPLRGIFDLDSFHISRSLARLIRQEKYRVTFNADFSGVVESCADRTETWINSTLFSLYTTLHATGHAHSVEIRDGDSLVGGVFGLTIGGAFFGESMFSHAPNTSKIALAYLVHRLGNSGFSLFDTQFITPHLASLGAIEIERHEYKTRLARAITRSANFNRTRGSVPAQSVLQFNTQTS